MGIKEEAVKLGITLSNLTKILRVTPAAIYQYNKKGIPSHVVVIIKILHRLKNVGIPLDVELTPEQEEELALTVRPLINRMVRKEKILKMKQEYHELRGKMEKEYFELTGEYLGAEKEVKPVNAAPVTKEWMRE